MARPGHAQWHDRTNKHGRAAWHDLAVPFCWPAAVIFLRAPPSHARVLPCFPLLDVLGARGFLEFLIFLKIAREVFFSIET